MNNIKLLILRQQVKMLNSLYNFRLDEFKNIETISNNGINNINQQKKMLKKLMYILLALGAFSFIIAPNVIMGSLLIGDIVILKIVDKIGKDAVKKINDKVKSAIKAKDELFEELYQAKQELKEYEKRNEEGLIPQDNIEMSSINYSDIINELYSLEAEFLNKCNQYNILLDKTEKLEQEKTNSGIPKKIIATNKKRSRNFFIRFILIFIVSRILEFIFPNYSNLLGNMENVAVILNSGIYLFGGPKPQQDDDLQELFKVLSEKDELYTELCDLKEKIYNLKKSVNCCNSEYEKSKENEINNIDFAPVVSETITTNIVNESPLIKSLTYKGN